MVVPNNALDAPSDVNKPGVIDGSSASRRESDGCANNPDRDETVATTATAKQQQQQMQAAPDDAPPPWHTAAYVYISFFYHLYALPSIESLDEIATIETLTNRVFPTRVSAATLGCVRLFYASIVWATVIEFVFFSNGYDQDTKYLTSKGSRLTPGVTIKLRGIRVLAAFTMWCWLLLGCCFACTSYIALRVAYHEDYNNKNDTSNAITISPWLLRVAFLMWEASAPLATFVSFIIRYVIWPEILKTKKKTNLLRSFRSLLGHNANSFFVLTEVGLLGGLPVRSGDVSVASIVGAFYIFFSWAMRNSWSPVSKKPLSSSTTTTTETETKQRLGPQFLYFFLDTTLGYKTLVNYVLLDLVYHVVYYFHVYLQYLLNGILSLLSRYNAITDATITEDADTNELIARTIYVFGALSLLMRFRD